MAKRWNPLMLWLLSWINTRLIILIPSVGTMICTQNAHMQHDHINIFLRNFWNASESVQSLAARCYPHHWSEFKQQPWKVEGGEVAGAFYAAHVGKEIYNSLQSPVSHTQPSSSAPFELHLFPFLSRPPFFLSPCVLCDQHFFMFPYIRSEMWYRESSRERNSKGLILCFTTLLVVNGGFQTDAG